MKKHLLTTIFFSVICLSAISQEIPKFTLRTDSLNELSLLERWKKDSIKIFSFDTLNISKDSIPLIIQRPFDMEKFKEFAQSYPKKPINSLNVVEPPKGNYSLIVVPPDTTVHFYLKNGLIK